MRLLCYADDPREPEFIGETVVNLTEVLTRGETDGQCHRRRRPLLAPSTGPLAWGMLTFLSRVVHTHEQRQVFWGSLFGDDFLVQRTANFIGSLGGTDGRSCLIRTNHRRRKLEIGHQVFIPITVDQGHLLPRMDPDEAVAQEARRREGAGGLPTTKGKVPCLLMAHNRQSHLQVLSLS